MGDGADRVTDRELSLVLRMVQQGHDTLSSQMRDGFGTIDRHLTMLNGQTGKNTGNIIALQTEVHAACGRIEDVESTVHAIQTEGCAVRGARHDGTVPERRFWGLSHREVRVGAAAVGAGAVILKVLEVASDWLHHAWNWK